MLAVSGAYAGPKINRTRGVGSGTRTTPLFFYTRVYFSYRGSALPRAISISVRYAWSQLLLPLDRCLCSSQSCPS